MDGSSRAAIALYCAPGGAGYLHGAGTAACAAMTAGLHYLGQIPCSLLTGGAGVAFAKATAMALLSFMRV